MNYIFGSSFGQDVERAILFGSVSLVADLWKAAGPVYLATLWRDRRIVSLAPLSLLWLACLGYAIACAIGFAASGRTTVTETRRAATLAYIELRDELAAQEQRKSALAAHRSAGEVRAHLDALLQKPVLDGERVRGTIGSLSAQCSRGHVRTLIYCEQVQNLRQELATAMEAESLERHIADLRSKASSQHAGNMPSDPQAETISTLLGNVASSADVAVAITMLMVTVIELVSAFGLSTVVAFVEATGSHRQRSAHQVSSDQDAEVLEYLADRLSPGEDEMDGPKLHDDYVAWSIRRGFAPVGVVPFLTAVDRIRAHHGLADAIGKFGNKYFGISLRPR